MLKVLAAHARFEGSSTHVESGNDPTRKVKRGQACRPVFILRNADLDRWKIELKCGSIEANVGNRCRHICERELSHCLSSE